MSIQPFKVDIPQATLDDLRERLGRTRWPDEIEGADWDYGTNLGYLKELTNYWQHTFDWRKQEAMFNRFAHFRAEVDGLGIHFIHERGKGPNPTPIILTHGWPGSFFEMLKIIPMLTDPESYGGKAEDAFDVVVPSLPGYGFSDRPTQRGMTTSRIADMWTDLMTKELGYQRFAAQGGDWGSGVTEQLAVSHPDVLLGFHLNNIPFIHLFAKVDNLSQDEKTYLAAAGIWQRQEGAYAAIQGSKPQTLGYGLNDSPAGLAGWIVEKFRSWSDCAGDVEKRFTKDELLTTITLYWVTETINSANRLYYERARNATPLSTTGKSNVPAAIARFPQDILPAPREWAERWFNVQRWTAMPRGGHFAALEEPELLAEDIRTFFHDLKAKH
ncbi:MAG: epoxide hydrolase [Ktedonobacteraceae bacterium]